MISIEDEQKIEENHKKAFEIIQYFFSGTDIFFILIFLCITGFNFNRISKLLSIMSLDIILRVIELFTYSIQNSFNKELFISIIESIQFILVMLFINNVMSNSSNNDNYENIISIFEVVLFTVLFYLIIFPFEKFVFNNTNNFFIGKCVTASLIIFILYKCIGGKYKEFLKNILVKIQDNIFLYSILVNLPSLAFYVFIARYSLNLLLLVIKNKLYVSYLEMILISFNEAGKYSVIVVLAGLLYINQDSYSNSGSRGSYKDDVEVDQNWS